MASRRMFAKVVVDSDAFLDMPLTAQALYFHLGIQADDDGFVASPKKIIRGIGATNEDLETLIDHQFIIPFASGVIVIRHWLVNNKIRKERHTDTECKEELAQLIVTENKPYRVTDG